MASPCRKRRFVSHGGDVWGFSRKHNIPVEKCLISARHQLSWSITQGRRSSQSNAGLIRFYPDPNPVE